MFFDSLFNTRGLKVFVTGSMQRKRASTPTEFLFHRRLQWSRFRRLAQSSLAARPFGLSFGAIRYPALAEMRSALAYRSGQPLVFQGDVLEKLFGKEGVREMYFDDPDDDHASNYGGILPKVCVGSTKMFSARFP
jgi:hypothetical protein